MSFLYKKDEELTPEEWRLRQEGMISMFKDENQKPVTYDQWKNRDLSDDDLKLFKDM